MQRSFVGTFRLLAVTLMLTSGCTDDNPTAVLPDPEASFSWHGRAVAPATMTFENQSLHADRYYWDFGDSTTSEETNPVHIFGESGTYTVLLRAIQNNSGIVSESSQYLTIAGDPPVADFTWSGDTIAPAIISFQNLSQNADRYSWNFGDGSTIEAKNPVHIFQQGRSYNVTLLAQQSATNSAVLTTKTISISWPDPVADFDWTGETIVGSYITLHDRSGNADEVFWLVEGGSAIFFERPMYYGQAGNFALTLVARNSATGKADTTTKVLAITPSMVSLVKITVHQIPFVDSLGNPWDVGNGPDVMFFMYGPNGGIVLYSGSVMLNIRPENLPLVYYADVPVTFTRSYLDEIFRFDFHEIEVGVAPMGRLMGQVSFIINDLKLTQGYRGVYTLENDGFKVEIGLDWSGE